MLSFFDGLLVAFVLSFFELNGSTLLSLQSAFKHCIQIYENERVVMGTAVECNFDARTEQPINKLCFTNRIVQELAWFIFFLSGQKLLIVAIS